MTDSFVGDRNHFYGFDFYVDQETIKEPQEQYSKEKPACKSSVLRLPCQILTAKSGLLFYKNAYHS